MDIIEVKDIAVLKDGVLRSLRDQKVCREGALHAFAAGSGVVKDQGLYVLDIFNRQAFDSPGVYSLELQKGRYRVVMIGGGGSGSTDGNRCDWVGGGGNSGQGYVCVLNIPVDTSVEITVGAGGKGMSGNGHLGTIGGNTSFCIAGLSFTLVAIGGMGGSIPRYGNSGAQIDQVTGVVYPSVTSIIESVTDCVMRQGNLSSLGGYFTDEERKLKSGESGIEINIGENSRYQSTCVVCSSGGSGTNTYGNSAYGRTPRSPDGNGGGSNQGSASMPVEYSHGLTPGCGGGAMNFTANHAGAGGNGGDGYVYVELLGASTL